MPRLLCRLLLTPRRRLTTRHPLLRLLPIHPIMSTPAATSAPSSTFAASSSTSSASAPSPTNLSHVPECPRFKTVVVGDRLYRQQVIHPPGGHSAPFHASPTASSPAATARPTGTSTTSAPFRLPPLDESLLPSVEEVSDETGGLLYRLCVDVEYACMLSSSMSRQQRAAVEDIERTHRTSIQLPNKTPHSHTIVVTGVDREGVVHSKQAIDRLLTQLIADCPYTHFLSLPLPTFHSSLDSFRATVLASFPTAAGLHPSIFVRPTSLHFTVAMLTLPTAHHVQRAAAALTSVAVPMSDGGFSVRLCGLAVMNERPEAAHVLYIQPDDVSQQRLSELAGRLVGVMRQAGVLSDSEVRKQRLMQRDRLTGEEAVSVKWHCTVMNTKHRRRGGHDTGTNSTAAQTEGGGGGRRGQGWNKRQAVDVSGVLAQYGDLDWGEGAVNACELSALSWDNKTNFYPCEAKLPL